jgi:hypothetical protein
MKNIPSDSHIRSMLEGVPPKHLEPIYQLVFERLEGGGILEPFRSYTKSLLIAMDGTEYFSSSKIHRCNCSHRERSNGKMNYSHSVLTPVIVQAGNEREISLEPEFITPQDGHEKQDCEIEAGKRWLRGPGKNYAKRNATLPGDALRCASCQPFCVALQEAGPHFILVCKPDSQPHLYESVAFWEAQGLLGKSQKRLWNGKHGELHTYRYANQLPLRAGNDALLVNWVELTITHEETGEISSKNAFISDFEVLETTIAAIARAGKSKTTLPWRAVPGKQQYSKNPRLSPRT